MSRGMSTFIDARIPLMFGQLDDAGPTDAVLWEGPAEALGGERWAMAPYQAFQPGPDGIHPASCVCCMPRSAAASALARLMLDRSKGAGVFFNRIVAVTSTEAGRASVRQALADDAIASAYIREKR
jgi:hypothetical protein